VTNLFYQVGITLALFSVIISIIIIILSEAYC